MRWLYYRFAVSFRDIEEMLASRGVTVSHESVFEKVHVGTIRLSMSRMAAMSIMVSEVCTQYS